MKTFDVVERCVLWMTFFVVFIFVHSFQSDIVRLRDYGKYECNRCYNIVMTDFNKRIGVERDNMITMNNNIRYQAKRFESYYNYLIHTFEGREQ